MKWGKITGKKAEQVKVYSLRSAGTKFEICETGTPWYPAPYLILSLLVPITSCHAVVDIWPYAGATVLKTGTLFAFTTCPALLNKSPY
mgnify:CR=1 FL=1